MAKVDRYFRLAQSIALKGDAKNVRRHYRLGAVGIRNDGTTVTANNVPCRQLHAQAHAEARLVRKLDRGADVYVVRIRRNGTLANARPCYNCQNAMRARGVHRCYYSISNNEYGVLYL
jgi:cytidine deaminase